MVAQHRAQGRLQQVGSGMVAGRGLALVNCNGQIDCIPQIDAPLLDQHLVYHQIGKGT